MSIISVKLKVLCNPVQLQLAQTVCAEYYVFGNRFQSRKSAQR